MLLLNLIGETFQRRVTVNVLSKHFWAADKVWFFSFEDDEVLITPYGKNLTILQTSHKSFRIRLILWYNLSDGKWK
jgi:hypothetical protein